MQDWEGRGVEKPSPAAGYSGGSKAGTGKLMRGSDGGSRGSGGHSKFVDISPSGAAAAWCRS